MNKIFLAQQMNRFVQMSVQSANLTDEQAMQIADLYPDWAAMKAYAADEIVKFGVNADGERSFTRLFRHTLHKQTGHRTQPLLSIRKSALLMMAFPFGHSRLVQQMPT